MAMFGYDDGVFFISKSKDLPNLFLMYRRGGHGTKMLVGGVKHCEFGWYADIFGDSIKDCTTVAEGLQDEGAALDALWEHRDQSGNQKHLHVYTQDGPGETLEIFGTDEGLQALSEALNILQNSKVDEAGISVISKGKPYPVRVVRKKAEAFRCMESPWPVDDYACQVYSLGVGDLSRSVFLTFGDNGYIENVHVMVEGSYTGLAAIQRAMTLLYAALMPDATAPAEMVVSLYSDRRLISDNENQGVEWLHSLLIGARVIQSTTPEPGHDQAKEAPGQAPQEPARVARIDAAA